MNEQSNGTNGGGDDERKSGSDQGHRSMDQMGTHGGPAQGEKSGQGGGGPGPFERRETGGHPGSSAAESQKEGAPPAERESVASQTMSRVKNLARGLMDKAAEAIETGVQTGREKLEEMAEAAPKIQARLKRKAAKVARGKARKPAARKPARGKAGKAGRRAAARGAKKGAGRKKQKGGKARSSAKRGRGKAGGKKRSSRRGGAR